MNFPACLFGVRTYWLWRLCFFCRRTGMGRGIYNKSCPEEQLLLLMSFRSTYLVAFSRRFIIIKMNSAEIKHNTMRIDHNAHNSICPQSIPMMETR